MTRHPFPRKRLLRRLARDERGTTLVELAIVLPLFLLLFFGLIDFGRLGFEYVMTGKATDIATRIAVVRPAACPGVPTTNARGPVAAGTVPPRFGTNCGAGGSVCADPGTITCAGSAANATSAEIWAAISGVMPTGATQANLRFSYAYDPNLGFLGGPYVPMVTVEISNLSFQFATPLGGLAQLTGNTLGVGPTITFPSMSVSLPGEDLAQGNNG